MQAGALAQRIRETLESGQTIAVLGWNHRRHNEFTRELVDGPVIFYNALPAKLAASVGLILFTKYVDHNATRKLKRTTPIHSTVLEVREIKEILASCEDILLPPPKPVAREGPKAGATGPPNRLISPEAEAYDLEALDFITTPREAKPVNPMVRFARAFLKMADKNGRVGKMKLKGLRENNGVAADPPHLIEDGWLVGLRPGEGKKISQYTATDKLRELAANPKECEVPENPYEFARWLVAQEPSLLELQAEIMAEMEARLAPIRMQLEQLEVAKRALACFDEQLRPLKKPG